MKKGKIGIGLLSAAVLFVILLMAIHTIPAASGGNPVMLQAGDERLEVWTADGDAFYAFLPGHARLQDAVILPVRDDVTVDGLPLPLPCGLLEEKQVHDLSWQENGQQRQGTLQLINTQGVATLYLQTQSGSMEYIHEEKGNAERGSLRLYDEAGALNYSGSISALRGRGNSTWVVHEKKPYSLELTEEADFLGMGAAKKWVLLADALDCSAMRNKIVLDLAARIGMPYTPESRWTEVYLNGEYAGLYLLCERVEIEPQRLDLSPDDSLICLGWDTRIQEDSDPWFVTENGQCVQIRESSDIGALKKQIQAMETAVLSEDSQWQAHIDLDSWVKKYLIEELVGSYDAGFQSQYYFTRETGGTRIIYAGPVWDYDSSLGNPQVWSLNSPQGLYAWRPEVMAGYPTPWLHSLYAKDAFREELQEIYRSEVLPILETLMEETLTAYADQIAPAFRRNQIRWQVQTEGIAAETAYIVSYLQERRDFLSRFWLEERDFCILRLQEGSEGGYYGYYAVEPGTCFDALPEKAGEDFLGWYREDTDTVFDPAEPVTEDLCLYPRYEGSKPAEADSGDGLLAKILKGYHYVPAVVLVLLGAVFVPLGIQKSKSREKRETTNLH